MNLTSPSLLTAEETWRPVRDYKGWYEVSDQGNVYALSRPGTRGGLLTPQLTLTGYRFVRLHKYGRVRTVTVARLVLEAFDWPPPPGKRRARHREGRRDDGLADLYWG